MEYTNFDRDFMMRTLSIVKNYDGDYEGTLLINCLLGLLILPKEKLDDKIPDISECSFGDWGIHRSAIKNSGRCDYGHKHKLNLKQLLRFMRNAVAHLKISADHENGAIKGYSFKDRNNFHLVLTIGELKNFVIKLAEHCLK